MHPPREAATTTVAAPTHGEATSNTMMAPAASARTLAMTDPAQAPPPTPATAAVSVAASTPPAGSTTSASPTPSAVAMPETPGTGTSDLERREDKYRTILMKMSDLELDKLAGRAEAHDMFPCYRFHQRDQVFGVGSVGELPPFGEGDLLEELVQWQLWLADNKQMDSPPAPPRSVEAIQHQQAFGSNSSIPNYSS